MSSNCPTCGANYDSLGSHFQWKPEHRPEPTDRQLGAIEFLKLRGAHVRDDGANPFLEVYTTSEPWIRTFAALLGWLANEPRIHESTTDVAESDVWAISTVPHPCFKKSVEELRLLTLRLLLNDAATWRGLIFGSLHVDVRGYDTDGERVANLFRELGIQTIEGTRWDDELGKRHHPSDDVVCVPHYDAIELLEFADLSVSDAAEPIELG